MSMTSSGHWFLYLGFLFTFFFFFLEWSWGENLKTISEEAILIVKHINLIFPTVFLFIYFFSCFTIFESIWSAIKNTVKKFHLYHFRIGMAFCLKYEQEISGEQEYMSQAPTVHVHIPFEWLVKNLLLYNLHKRRELQRSWST